jgi:hypothetical protein
LEPLPEEFPLPEALDPPEDASPPEPLWLDVLVPCSGDGEPKLMLQPLKRHAPHSTTIALNHRLTILTPPISFGLKFPAVRTLPFQILPQFCETRPFRVSIQTPSIRTVTPGQIWLHTIHVTE